jgi:DNA polymerase epsilon subunit 1
MARGRGTFGIPAFNRGRGRGGSRRGYRGNFRGRGRGGAATRNGPAPVRADDATQLEDKFENVRQRDEIDEKLGFHRVSDGPKREGWMVNMHPVSYALFTFLITANTYPILDTNEVGRLAVGTRRR